MSFQAKIIADSVSGDGVRLTTFQLKFHRFILPEFNTHRSFSRNFSSSRAIPVAKIIEQVRFDPAIPVHWGKNQPGMQAKEELTGPALDICKKYWEIAAKNAADTAAEMHDLGLHKQVVNRILEPFQWVSGVVTATEWDNFFELRAHPDAQPEIQALAYLMQEKMEASPPREMKRGDWHLPYVQPHEFADYGDDVELLKKVSAARCCRVSYMKHDGTHANIEEDLALCNRLVGSRPLHASPFEHQATPDQWNVQRGGGFVWDYPHLHGNFNGWIQHRKEVELEVWNKEV